MTREMNPAPEEPDADFPLEDGPGFEVPKIGKFVEQHVLAIAEYCERHPDEFLRLQDDAYSKSMLNLNYPLFRKTEGLSGKYAGRYRKNPQVVVNGETVHFTNDLFPRHYKPFITYLTAKRLLSTASAEQLIAALPAASIAKKASGQIKSYPIGNAQNYATRTVLDRTHPGPTAAEWLATIAEFGHACAYCRRTESELENDFVFEHIVGINMKDLGENVIGNVVPACAPCNEAKGSKNYLEWIATSPRITDAPAVLASIQAHMTAHGYVPLTELFPAEDRQRLDIAINQLRDELDAAATRCAKIIKNLKAERGASRTR
ncbi:HNH endonuclease [Nocardioides sp. zg-536]|uniref:HNH endonuclease n=1 Tax=Nocardioides faecalis TaxID=2803858 RepID=A0A939BWV6_9ACTN|nr:HNH endonuclease signature motif containing protein [Nocardioides faecalis]MBM9458758.1 HNH endonuclease [Nocardioides faecalis]QVI60176.1 HNH endonuclease [Nocardioides faecalis]